MTENAETTAVTLTNYLSSGLSATKALDYHLVVDAGLPVAFVAQLRGVSESAVEQSVGKAARTLGTADDETDESAADGDYPYWCEEHQEGFDNMGVYANHMKWEHHGGKKEDL